MNENTYSFYMCFCSFIKRINNPVVIRQNRVIMFYFYEPIHFKSSAIRYFGRGEKSPHDILSNMPCLDDNYYFYYKTDTSLLFPQVGKINVEKQGQKKMWIVPYDEETAPYIKHAFTTSHHNNMMCILITTVEDEIPVEIYANTNYFLLEGGMSPETYKDIYEKHQLVHSIDWLEYQIRCKTGSGFLINLHTLVKKG